MNQVMKTKNSRVGSTETAAEASDLVAGHKLDMMVAERVMGWVRGPRWGNGNGGWTIDGKAYDHGVGTSWEQTPRFSTDIAAAMRILDKAEGLWELSRFPQSGSLHLVYECRLRFGGDIGYAIADTLPEAICRAALQAAASALRGIVSGPTD